MFSTSGNARALHGPTQTSQPLKKMIPCLINHHSNSVPNFHILTRKDPIQKFKTQSKFVYIQKSRTHRKKMLISKHPVELSVDANFQSHHAHGSHLVHGRTLIYLLSIAATINQVGSTSKLAIELSVDQCKAPQQTKTRRTRQMVELSPATYWISCVDGG